MDAYLKCAVCHSTKTLVSAYGATLCESCFVSYKSQDMAQQAQAPSTSTSPVCAVCDPWLGADAEAVCSPCYKHFLKHAKDVNLLCQTGKFHCPIYKSHQYKCHACFVRKCRQVGMELEGERKAREVEESQKVRPQASPAPSMSPSAEASSPPTAPGPDNIPASVPDEVAKAIKLSEEIRRGYSRRVIKVSDYLERIKKGPQERNNNSISNTQNYIPQGSNTETGPTRDGNSVMNVAPKCQVCSSKKNLFSGFGAKTLCLACKMFFSSSKGSAKGFKCRRYGCEVPGGGPFCTITEATRARCEACHYEKCLMVGLQHPDVRKANIISLNKRFEKVSNPKGGRGSLWRMCPPNTQNYIPQAPAPPILPLMQQTSAADKSVINDEADQTTNRKPEASEASESVPSEAMHLPIPQSEPTLTRESTPYIPESPTVPQDSDLKARAEEIIRRHLEYGSDKPQTHISITKDDTPRGSNAETGPTHDGQSDKSVIHDEPDQMKNKKPQASEVPSEASESVPSEAMHLPIPQSDPTLTRESTPDIPELPAVPQDSDLKARAAKDLKEHLGLGGEFASLSEGDKSEAGQRLKSILATVAGGALVPLLGRYSVMQ